MEVIELNREEYEISVIESLKKKAKNARIVPLPEWVVSEGVDSDTTLSAGLRDSYTGYMLGRTGYGTLNNALTREGLSNSGYRDYLEGRINSDREEEERGLIAEYNNQREKNLTEYSGYIDEKNEEMDESYYNAINNIVTMGILNYEVAYAQGRLLGFDEARASMIAKTAITKLRFRLRSKVLNAIVAKKLNSSGAINLALSYGLEYDDAIEMGKNAKKINEAHSDTGIYPITLVDKLKDLENQKRIEEEKKLK